MSGLIPGTGGGGSRPGNYPAPSAGPATQAPAAKPAARAPKPVLAPVGEPVVPERPEFRRKGTAPRVANVSTLLGAADTLG